MEADLELSRLNVEKARRIKVVEDEKEKAIQKEILTLCNVLRAKDITRITCKKQPEEEGKESGGKARSISLLEKFTEKPYEAEGMDSLDVFFELRNYLKEQSDKEAGQKDQFVSRLFRDTDYKGRG